MKKYILSLAVVVAAIAIAAFTPGDIVTIAIGDAAPKADVKLSTTSGGSLALNDVKKANGLLVVFSCNSCPFVVGSEGSDGWEGRYADLYTLATASNIGMVLLNSNEGKRTDGDSMEDMKAHAIEKGYSQITYALDTNSELANAFGGRTTPHVFLFNKDMKLVYKGAIDDNVASAKEVKEPWLKNAITNLAKGVAISPAETKAIGCSIKRPK
ncbi:MAG: redoxin family protein [Flavobacteriales bacterium]